MRKDGTLTSRERRELWTDDEPPKPKDPYEHLLPENYVEPEANDA